VTDDEARIIELEAELAALKAKAASPPAKKKPVRKTSGRVTKKAARRAPTSSGEQRLRVRSVRRKEPDARKVAQAIIELATKQAQGWERKDDVSGMEGDGT
jgi:uncharacterized ferredoxin-like protein